ncbi:hypothetical protein [Insolitispirillum peregrinum]|uniref:hypothetical protein n=1 Tax=Insolitispirillum peregrinum TaxID=80876 RepID=UPI00361F3C79
MKKYDDTMYWDSDDELGYILSTAWHDLFNYIKIKPVPQYIHLNRWGPEKSDVFHLKEIIENGTFIEDNKIDFKSIFRDMINVHGISNDDILFNIVKSENCDYEDKFIFKFKNSTQEDNIFDYLERCYKFLYEDKDFEYIDIEFRKEAAWRAFFYFGFPQDSDRKYVSLRKIVHSEIRRILGDSLFQAMLRDAIDNRIFDPKNLKWWLRISIHHGRNQAEVCYAFLERLYRYIYLDDTFDPRPRCIPINEYSTYQEGHSHLFDELIAFIDKIRLPLAEGEIECYDGSPPHGKLRHILLKIKEKLGLGGIAPKRVGR